VSDDVVYPIKLIDTRHVEWREGDVYRGKVVKAIRADGTEETLDVVVNWGNIAVIWSDWTYATYRPDMAAEFWEEKFVR
jgi:hypothetical protein